MLHQFSIAIAPSTLRARHAKRVPLLHTLPRSGSVCAHAENNRSQKLRQIRHVTQLAADSCSWRTVVRSINTVRGGQLFAARTQFAAANSSPWRTGVRHANIVRGGGQFAVADSCSPREHSSRRTVVRLANGSSRRTVVRGGLLFAARTLSVSAADNCSPREHCSRRTDVRE